MIEFFIFSASLSLNKSVVLARHHVASTQAQAGSDSTTRPGVALQNGTIGPIVSSSTSVPLWADGRVNGGAACLPACLGVRPAHLLSASSFPYLASVSSLSLIRGMERKEVCVCACANPELGEIRQGKLKENGTDIIYSVCATGPGQE